jgi:hypothetical protein
MTDKHTTAIICFFLLTALYLAVAPGVSANLQRQSIDTSIEKLESAISTASELYDSGALTDASPYKAEIAPNLTLSFSKTTFETDLSLAFDQYEILLTEKESVTSRQSPPQPGPPAAPVAAEIKTAAPAPAPSNAEPVDEITALMQAEQETGAAQPAGQNSNFDTGGFDVYNNYSASHSTTLQQADQMAEYDMQNLVAQRQAAEAERLSKMQRDQELQGQAMEWQAQLDKQASESARKAAEWEATHSFGAYATTFLATVAQTAIGSFTGGLLTPVATTLANKAVKSLFDIDAGAIDSANKPPSKQ